VVLKLLFKLAKFLQEIVAFRSNLHVKGFLLLRSTSSSIVTSARHSIAGPLYSKTASIVFCIVDLEQLGLFWLIRHFFVIFILDQSLQVVLLVLENALFHLLLGHTNLGLWCHKVKGPKNVLTSRRLFFLVNVASSQWFRDALSSENNVLGVFRRVSMILLFYAGWPKVLLLLLPIA